MQLQTSKDFGAIPCPLDHSYETVSELGPGFTDMPQSEPISMIEQTISAWTPGRAAIALWSLVQRGARAAWASTTSEARS